MTEPANLYDLPPASRSGRSPDDAHGGVKFNMRSDDLCKDGKLVDLFVIPDPLEKLSFDVFKGLWMYFRIYDPEAKAKFPLPEQIKNKAISPRAIEIFKEEYLAIFPIFKKFVTAETAMRIDFESSDFTETIFSVFYTGFPDCSFPFKLFGGEFYETDKANHTAMIIAIRQDFKLENVKKIYIAKVIEAWVDLHQNDKLDEKILAANE